MKTVCFSMCLPLLLACARSAPIAPVPKAEPATYILRRLDTIVVNACGIKGPRTSVSESDFSSLLSAMGYGCETAEAKAFQLLPSDGTLSIFDYRPKTDTCHTIIDMRGDRGEFLAAFPGYIQYGCIRRNRNVWLLDFGTIIQE